jgi:excinuclease UvrABC nuclease subunit
LTEFIDLISQASVHRHHMLLWPYRWKLHDLALILDWQEIPFRSDCVDQVPNEPGVYAFYIQPRLPSKESASYLMYVGETERPLRQRFREYLRESGSATGRPKLSAMLPLYEGFLYFHCSVVVSPEIPEQIESQLQETYLPPWNDRFPASVSRVMRAF